MLNQLHVQNFALIQDLTLQLKSGLNIITGETGAGKSILLNALGLLSGKRADLSIIRKGTKKCIVEGDFSLKDYGLERFFQLNDLDFEEPTIIRREISISGKSRSFINDTPVKLSVLKELGDRVIDVHSQHSNLVLGKSEFAFNLLDNYSGNTNALSSFKNLFFEYIEKQKQLEELQYKQQQEKLNLEFNQFQYNELVSHNLESGEQEALEKEFEILNNAEEIKSNGSIVVNNISYTNSSVQELLQEAINSLDKLSSFDESYTSLKNRLSSAEIEVKDISDEVQDKISRINSDFTRVQQINERLDLIYSLQKKYNASSVEQLIEKLHELKKSINLVIGGDEELIRLSEEIKVSKSTLLQKAKVVSDVRKKAAPNVTKQIIKDLELMGIHKPQMNFKFSNAELNAFGMDQIELLFSANRGTPLGKIDKIASGGELSRLMLSIKKIIGLKTALPTIVFDEIDTGVSGEVASQMGRLMKEMAKTIQVVAITHLPQIAAKGHAHFKVFKSNLNEQTTSEIKQLTKESRIDEIAEMLSGLNVSQSARQNASELLNQI